MSRKILIVDDNPNMSSLLCEMLEVFDYESVRAADGHQALTELGKGGIAMVITDVRMPNMGGVELLHLVKDKFPRLPVVLISGYANNLDSQSGVHRADGYLGKPLMMSDIERLLTQLL